MPKLQCPHSKKCELITRLSYFGTGAATLLYSGGTIVILREGGGGRGGGLCYSQGEVFRKQGKKLITMLYMSFLIAGYWPVLGRTSKGRLFLEALAEREEANRNGKMTVRASWKGF